MSEPHLFVIYGGTGDLTRRKLLPAMYQIMVESGISDESVLLGIGSSEQADDEYRKFARDSLAAAGVESADPWCDDRVYYQQISRDATDLAALP